MDNGRVPGVEVLHSSNNFLDHLLHSCLVESAHFPQLLVQLPILGKLQHQVYILVILEAIVHLDDILVLQGRGDVNFGVYLGDHVLLLQVGFLHALQCECSLIF